MKKNMGIFDRVVRMVAAIVLMDLSLSGVTAGIWNGLSWIVVADFEVTGLIAWCPLYAIFNLHTDFRKKVTGS